MNKTMSVLLDMFRENTGAHFLDSGGRPKYDENGNYIGSEFGYGRQHERNKNRDLVNEAPVKLNFNIRGGDLEIDFVVKTFHWLLNRCEFNEEFNNLFYGKFLEEQDPDDRKSWFELMNKFPEWLSKQTDDDGDSLYGKSSGIYGEGEPVSINTYNEQNLLDQTLQFIYFTNNSGEFIILQVHGGADVRGGYTKPKIFSVGNRSELDIISFNTGNIYCTGKDHHPSALVLKEKQELQLDLPGIESKKIDFDGSNEHYWSTDDAYHWYHQGTCGAGYKKLEDYDYKNISDDSDEENKDWEEGVICVKDRVGYCPFCGAVLAGSE